MHPQDLYHIPGNSEQHADAATAKVWQLPCNMEEESS